jgi:hypothetical protein
MAKEQSTDHHDEKHDEKRTSASLDLSINATDVENGNGKEGGKTSMKGLSFPRRLARCAFVPIFVARMEGKRKARPRRLPLLAASMT